MTLTRTSVLIAIAAATLSAQYGPRPDRNRPQGPRGPRVSELADFLGLTPTQLETVAQIQRDYRNAVHDNLQAIAENRRQANVSLDSDSPDATLIGQLLVQAKQMEDSVRSREDEFISQMQAVLTDSQRTKLSSLDRMVPYQTEIREAQALGLLAGEDGELHLRLGGPMSPLGPEGPPFGGPGFPRR